MGCCWKKKRNQGFLKDPKVAPAPPAHLVSELELEQPKMTDYNSKNFEVPSEKSSLINRSFREIYKVGKKLGEGGFAEVRECTHLELGTKRAVKQFRKSKLSETEKADNMW